MPSTILSAVFVLIVSCGSNPETVTTPAARASELDALGATQIQAIDTGQGYDSILSFCLDGIRYAETLSGSNSGENSALAMFRDVNCDG